jgi:hypothetical protein
MRGLALISIVLGIAILLAPHIDIASSISILTSRQEYMVKDNVYYIGLYKGFPSIEMIRGDGSGMHFYYIIKGIGETFNIAGVHAPTRNRVINRTNLVKHISDMESRGEGQGASVVKEVNSTIDTMIRSLSGGEEAMGYLSFDNVTWRLYGPEEIYDEDGVIAAVRFSFRPEGVANPHFGFIIDNLRVEFTIFKRSSEIKVFNHLYIVSDGDVKVNLIIDKWDWTSVDKLVESIKGRYPDLRLSISLTLFSETMGPGRSPTPTNKMMYRVYSDGDVMMMEDMGDSDIPLSSEGLTYMAIENPEITGSLATIRFIGSAYRISKTIDEEPVMVSVHTMMYRSEIYLSFPYFGNSSMIYDPILSFHIPVQNQSTINEMSRNTYTKLTSSAVKEPISHVELYTEEQFIPPLRTDMLLSILLAIILIFAGVALGKKRFEV